MDIYDVSCLICIVLCLLGVLKARLVTNSSQEFPLYFLSDLNKIGLLMA